MSSFGDSLPLISLVRRLRRLHSLVQFPLGPVQEFLSFGAVAGHVVVIGRARPVHLMNRFDHVIMDLVQVVPVVDPIRYGHRTGAKGQAGRSQYQ